MDGAGSAIPPSAPDPGRIASDVGPDVGPEVRFDIREVPFSRRGSWLDLSPVTGLHTLADDIHLVSHVHGMHAVLALVPERGGVRVTTSWEAEAATLTWRAADGGTVEAVFEDTTAIRLRGRGLDLRLRDPRGELTSFTGGYLFGDPVDEAAVLTSYETGRRYRTTSLTGRLDVTGAGALGTAERSVLLSGDDADGTWEARVEETTSVSLRAGAAAGFDEVAAQVRAEVAAHLAALAPWRSPDTPAAALAAYVLWSATVAPAGFVSRECVLMSMHWMDKAWSWDHCFNALALAPGLPDLALDQFLLPFDHQDAAGALPDSVTQAEVLFNFVKPPVHGWALRRLRERAGRALSREELETLHDRLARWSRFWLDHRRRPGHALPHYQHGNDSGWDNATTFDRERVVEAPDLAAVLVLQLEEVAALAADLGRPAASWRAERDALLDALVEQLWTVDGFVARGALDGRPGGSTSLLSLVPLVLGDRLPAHVRTVMVTRLQDHLTEHGLATEPVGSPHHEADGYWRGPVWAPSTALLEDGLRAAGYEALADTVSDRFRRLCERSGFAENFDARTGAGLRDRSYTWTAAVYLSLAADWEHRRAGARTRPADDADGAM